jgi:heat shock protein HslJ
MKGMPGMRGRIAPAGLGLVVLLTACGSADPATDPAALSGVTWVLDAASVGSLAADAPSDARVDLRFEDDRASGTSGCNTYGGDYEATDDGSLTFGALMVTAMACDEPLMALESAYLAALAEVEGFQVSDGGLLLDGAAVALTFVEEEPMEAMPLEGTEWVLDTVAAGDAVSSALAGTEVTLTLEGGAASGTAGCNRFSGGYTLDGGSLSFGPLATTKMACPDDVMDQEQAVLAALEGVAGWAVEGDRLSLADADGGLLLGYTGAP